MLWLFANETVIRYTSKFSVYFKYVKLVLFSRLHNNVRQIKQSEEESKASTRCAKQMEGAVRDLSEDWEGTEGKQTVRGVTCLLS